jgi:hypothetical protein
VDVFIIILHVRIILHGIRDNFNLVLFSAWIFSNLQKSSSLFNLFLFFDLFLFSLSLSRCGRSSFSLSFFLLLFSQLESCFLVLLLESFNFLSLFYSKLLFHHLFLLFDLVSFLDKFIVFLHLILFSFLFLSYSLCLSFLECS